MSDLLPPNATPQERALSDAITRVGNVPVVIREVWDPATCPANLLPWLAWAFSVDNWDTSWSDEQKRSVIAAAIDVQKHKGTIGAVVTALAALGYDTIIQEWFNMLPQGDPYTFDILLNNTTQEIDADVLQKIISVVESAKNLRSHLNKLKLFVSSKAQLHASAASITGSEIEYFAAAGALLLDGSWSLDGTYRLNGIKIGA